jgi:hypothetical protein
MSSCLLPTIQILQPSIQNPVLRPRTTNEKERSTAQPPRKLKKYPTGSKSSSASKLAKMRITIFRNTAFLSIIGLSNAQTSATWAQTQPFQVDVSTESLLGSSRQPLTNVVGTSTPDTTALAPVVPVTDQFSTTIPTELSTATSQATSVVTVTPSESAASASASSASASSESASRSASASRSGSASASGSGAATQSSAAAAPVSVNGQAKMMGVAGALAGAAGVLFV